MTDIGNHPGADRGGVHAAGANLPSSPAPSARLDVALAAAVPASGFAASWSNRNGGEILVTAGSLRLTVSAAFARAVHDRLGDALDVPRKARALAAQSLKPSELERLADPAPSIGQDFAERADALRRLVPHGATRLSAVREARALAEIEGAEMVAIAGLPFSFAEIDQMLAVGVFAKAAGAIAGDGSDC